MRVCARCRWQGACALILPGLGEATFGGVLAAGVRPSVAAPGGGLPPAEAAAALRMRRIVAGERALVQSCKPVGLYLRYEHMRAGA